MNITKRMLISIVIGIMTVQCFYLCTSIIFWVNPFEVPDWLASHQDFDVFVRFIGLGAVPFSYCLLTEAEIKKSVKEKGDKE